MDPGQVVLVEDNLKAHKSFFVEETSNWGINTPFTGPYSSYSEPNRALVRSMERSTPQAEIRGQEQLFKGIYDVAMDINRRGMRAHYTIVSRFSA